jgi:predicted O-linked N-acetylglucosamine transferase (SPINDLY family)
VASLDELSAACRDALAALAAPEDEGAAFEAAYAAIVAATQAGVLDDALEGVSLGVLLRLAAIDDAGRLWPFEAVGRALAARGDHRSLIYQLPRVRSDADRQALLAQHRAWGAAAEARAAADPVRPAPRGPRSRPRIGLVSSDLRLHAVGVFAQPVIDGAEAAGVELFCYSAHPAPPDGFEEHIATKATFRRLPGGDAHRVAQAIAADAPDLLIEIGGSTNYNALEAMAHRLAPVQMSWLGYPHSAGLSTIDRLLVDPHLTPTAPGLLIEQALPLARSWVAMSHVYFRRELPIATTLPQDRKGHVTFGSAGSPYKYSAATLDAWAQVLAAVPGSRFLIVRPEGGAPTFRRNVVARFAARGVDPGRIDFAPVRGGHLPYYSEIDVSLDSFPLTGGMTTCEALWMGAPVVTLAGKAVYERLSHSLLTNASLGDLSTASVAAFVARAADLAHDRARLLAWRAEGRDAITGGTLGDLDGFAQDFFATVTSAL